MFLFLFFFSACLKMKRKDEGEKKNIAIPLPFQGIDSCNELLRKCAGVLLIVTIKSQRCFEMLPALDSVLLRRC